MIILARGGGDATQLLPFSDEELCRAICATSTPVVAAIGHEGDRPLCDEVVDLRCGTPSLAAAAVVPDRDALLAALDAAWTRVEAAVVRRLDDATHRLAAVDRDRAVTAGVDRAAERLQRAAGRLELVHPKRRLGPATTALAAARREMEAPQPGAGPRTGLRGRPLGRRRIRAAARRRTSAAGQRLDVQLASGRLGATVDECDPVRRRRPQT